MYLLTSDLPSGYLGHFPDTLATPDSGDAMSGDKAMHIDGLIHFRCRTCPAKFAERPVSSLSDRRAWVKTSFDFKTFNYQYLIIQLKDYVIIIIEPNN